MAAYILPFFITFVFTTIFTPLVRSLALRVGAIDIPKDERRIHKRPMPLMGGFAIYLGILFSFILFLPMETSLTSILLGGTIILVSGIIDDIRGLKPMYKILFQVLACLVIIFGGVKIDFISNPFSQNSSLLYLRWLSLPITLFWTIGITNTINLIDGLDGLAAGVSMIASLSLMLVAERLGLTDITILSSMVAGACLGFLPYNFNPARIFMGDTGALLLGFLLAAISIEGVMKSVATIALVVPILILGVPIFDTTYAIIRRLLNGQPVRIADKSHLHHRLLAKGYNQRKTVLILYGFSLILGCSAIIVAINNSNQAVYLSMLTFIIGISFAFRLGIFAKK
ncbi:MAG: MraY family glycosyltransferase [Tissierellaceae bacterium]